MTIRAFEPGLTYWTRSLCDYDCIFTATIVRRTEKSVWIKAGPGLQRKSIYICDGVEHIYPLGRYSMAPTIGADRAVNEEEEAA